MNSDDIPTVEIGEFVSMRTVDLPETAEFMIQLRGPSRFRLLVAQKIFHTTFTVAEVEQFLSSSDVGTGRKFGEGAGDDGNLVR